MNAALRILTAILLGLFLAVFPASAAPLPAAATVAALPDVATLLRSIEANQEALDRAREEYTFRQQQRLTFYDNMTSSNVPRSASATSSSCTASRLKR